MKFMSVQGIGYWIAKDGPRSLHILVTSDDRSVVRTIRDEVVKALPGDQVANLTWQVDQYTQETIGVTLAAEGWEVFSITALDPTMEEDGPGCSPVYLVRQ